MDKKYISCIISAVISTLLQPLDASRMKLFFGDKMPTIKAAYNGCTFNYITHILKHSASYPTQEYVKNKLDHLPSFYREPLSGMIAGAILAIVSTPINVVKVPLITNQENRAIQLIRQIYKVDGLTGFFKGGIGTLMRDVVWSGVYFPAFYFINKKIDNRFMSSMLSASLAVCFSYSFDGIRLYKQNNKVNYDFWYGFRKSFNMSVENKQSFLLAILRVPISIACSHYVYLKCNDILE